MLVTSSLHGCFMGENSNLTDFQHLGTRDNMAGESCKASVFDG